MSTLAAGLGLVRFVSVTVFIPGEKPKRFAEGEILAAGLQDGTPLLAVRNAETSEVTEYMGLPLKIVKAAPTGLVAPSSGGMIIPPT